MKKWLILGGLLCLFGGLAPASIIPTFTNETGGGSLFTYNYDVNLDSLQNLVSGNQLCFADVFGLTGTPTASLNWTAANNTSSACPINAGTGAPGTPTNTAPSVLYTYSGPTINGPADLGTFSLQSTSGTTGLVAYGAVAQKMSNEPADCQPG